MDETPRFRDMDGAREKLLWLGLTPFMAFAWLLGLALKGYREPRPDGVHHLGDRYEVWSDGELVLETGNATAAANAAAGR